MPSHISFVSPAPLFWKRTTIAAGILISWFRLSFGNIDGSNPFLGFRGSPLSWPFANGYNLIHYHICRALRRQCLRPYPSPPCWPYMNCWRSFRVPPSVVWETSNECIMVASLAILPWPLRSLWPVPRSTLSVGMMPVKVSPVKHPCGLRHAHCIVLTPVMVKISPCSYMISPTIRSVFNPHTLSTACWPT